MTYDDFKALAEHLVERHGVHAEWYVQRAVCELSSKGEVSRAQNFELLASFIQDAAIALSQAPAQAPTTTTVH